MITDPSQLKHGAAITECLRTIFGNDIQSAIKVLEMTGMTIEQLDEDFETGVKNGYSIETQMKLLSAVIRMLDK